MTAMPASSVLSPSPLRFDNAFDHLRMVISDL